MKSYSIILASVAITCFFAACSKKDNAANTVTPVDALHPQAANVTQLPKSTYPYTDTFSGSMVVRFNDFGADFDSTNKNFKFYVTHLSDNLVMVEGSNPIQLEHYSGIITINDSVVLRSNNAVDSGDMHLFPYEHNSGQNIKDGIAFQLSEAKLLVSWDLPAIPLIGACDYGESIGNFTGSLTHKGR